MNHHKREILKILAELDRFHDKDEEAEKERENKIVRRVKPYVPPNSDTQDLDSSKRSGDGY